ncbi:hypothetical protein FRC06_000224 [Ceratobasidium sp. 370]|nr:hypothetical protein FRC06_000224 [Ceratobasidium sp. 370]
MVTESTRPEDIIRFIWESVVYQVLLGVAIGTCMGWLFRSSLRRAEAKGLIDRSSYLGQYLSLTILSLGATSLLGGDDLLAAFAAGSAVSWDGYFNEKSHESEFSNIIEVFFNCACFVYIGAWLPFEALKQDIDPHLVRRIPALIGLWLTGWLEPDVKTLGEALFSGHFGPMGVGAIFISMLALTKLPPPQGRVDDQVDCVVASIQPIVSFVVLGSIFIHGLSIPFFSFGSWFHLTYMKAKRGARQARETLRSASPFRRSRALPDEQRGLLSDEQGAGRYSVGPYTSYESRHGVRPILDESHA